MKLEVDIYKHLNEFDLHAQFHIEDEILGLMGASGSGKSMTLKCIAGIEKPDSGRIVLNDVVLFDSQKHIDLPIQKRNIGFVFQNYALFDNMTVFDNIACGLKARNTYSKELVINYLDTLQLSSVSMRYPRQLSGGQRQRVALARALIYKPDLVLLDEPLSALDEDLKQSVLNEMKKSLQEYMAIFVSHNSYEVEYLCSNIKKIKGGKIYE